MRNQLKKFRVRAGMTQMQVANAVGVSQPTYQRWETGAAAIPADRLRKLGKALGASGDELLGRHPPVSATLYDPDASAELSYYGEVSIHFRSGGPALVLSITDSAFSSLYADLQGDSDFVTVTSLSNQTVILRAEAVEDLYLCSEAHDDYGPEHGAYPKWVHLQMPDQRDWEIVEALACDLETDEYDPADVERVRSAILITDQQYESLIADGCIHPDELESEKLKNSAETQRIFDLARYVVYQLSGTGKKRQLYVPDDTDLYEAFSWLIEFPDVEDAAKFVRIDAESGHHVAFLSKSGFDYISIPTHRYETGSVEVAASELDE